MKSGMFRPVARKNRLLTRPDGHVAVPAAAIGGLSIVLAGGLAALGALDRVNTLVAGLVSRGGAEKFPKHLAGGWIWLATVVFAFGLSFAMLGTPGQWRRVVLWLTAAVLVAAWAPVLSLAAHAPEIAAPWIATVWSGVCSLVYAANHRMAVDPKPPPPDEPR
jgi:hypothetical protein